MKVLFIHRSVGQNIINDTKFRDVLDSSIQFCDINANTNIFTDARGVSGVSPIAVKDGNTEPEGLAVFLQNPHHQDFFGSFERIVFKSCYTANALNDDKKLALQKIEYSEIKEYITSHPKQIFIVCTSPPRKRLFTNKDKLKRAKSMHLWLLETFGEVSNVKVLDTFGILANSDGILDRKYRRIVFCDQHPNRQGSRVVADALKSLLL